jgi:SAM-dependent methyltransferase
MSCFETDKGAAAPAWEDREGWLDMIEELFDPATTERLERIGVSAGWRALEVGAGRGSVAAWLARRVGPGGHVVATDVDTRLLEPAPGTNLQVVRHDVLADDLAPDCFDLVHCRSLLVHLADPRRALERMVRWVRPGGVLIAEEPWVAAGLGSCDPALAGAIRALAVTMNGSFAGRLPEALREAGLGEVEAEGRVAAFAGGTRAASFHRLALEGACAPLVAQGSMDPEEVGRMSALLEDPAWSGWGWPRVGAWGRKPA